MTTPTAELPSALDYSAAARWPIRAATNALGIGLVLAVLIALPVAPTDLDRHQLPKETVVHVATWIAFLLARPLPLRGWSRAATWALGALVAVTIASSVVAQNGWLALRGASLIITSVTAVITARALSVHGMSRALLRWCAVAAVVGVATGLAQAYGVQSIFFAATRVPGGTFGNRNFLAHFAALAVPLVVYLTLTTRRVAWTVVTSLACVALAAAIVLSRSRAAWLGAGLGAMLFIGCCLITSRRRMLPAIAPRAIMLGAALVAGVVTAIVLPNRLSWRSSSPYTDTLAGLANKDDGSGRGRLIQYAATLRLAERHPILGVGPGNWPVRYSEVAPPSDPTWVFGDVVPINPWPSSDWMAMVSELGPLAVLAALLFGAALLWRAWGGVRTGGERMLAGASLAALLVTLFVEGNLDAVLLLPASSLFVAVAVGALLHECDEPSAPRVPTRATPHLITLSILALALISMRSTMQTLAYLIAGSGRSTRQLQWAARVDPGSYPIRIALAQRLSCSEARDDIEAAIAMAPNWPATTSAARRCGVRISR